MSELRYAGGELDEVWAQGHIHIEQLDSKTYHIIIKTAQGEAGLRLRSTKGLALLELEWAEGFKETHAGEEEAP